MGKPCRAMSNPSNLFIIQNIDPTFNDLITDHAKAKVKFRVVSMHQANLRCVV